MIASRALYERACRAIPGGVNSPVRSLRVVGGTPVAFMEGKGAYLRSIDGAEYVDFVMAWGALILGHAHERVQEAVCSGLRKGTHYGALTLGEVELAEKLCEAIPSMEMVRLVNSGTEATMSAVRLARAYTGRDMIVKFEGCYHGHADSFLVRRGADGDIYGVPSSPGVPKSISTFTVVVPYNDPLALRRAFETNKGKVAAVIMEPVAGNMGVVPPERDFLEEVANLTAAEGALLICDEVITGFRLEFGSCSRSLGLEPDLVCLGKSVGGGLPLAAYGGKREIMGTVAPSGEVYQAGTSAGNNASVTAALATLEVLSDTDPYPRLERLGAMLEKGLCGLASETGLPLAVNRVGSMLSLFFTENVVKDLAGAQASRHDLYARFFHMMLQNGIYIPPSPLEAWFISGDVCVAAKRRSAPWPLPWKDGRRREVRVDHGSLCSGCGKGSRHGTIPGNLSAGSGDNPAGRREQEGHRDNLPQKKEERSLRG